VAVRSLEKEIGRVEVNFKIALVIPYNLKQIYYVTNESIAALIARICMSRTV
jgi:hypothetical protein